MPDKRFDIFGIVTLSDCPSIVIVRVRPDILRSTDCAPPLGKPLTEIFPEALLRVRIPLENVP